jgi:peptide/nickel transport system substrate-binding protein
VATHRRRARGAADRRIRLRLEPAGRGRDPQALEASGKGRVNIVPAATSNSSCSATPTPGTRSTASAASAKSKHPAFHRQGRARGHGPADRPQGRAGLHLRPHRRGHAQLPEQPAALPQQEPKFEFNIDKANQILEAAGWKKGADGIRAKGNVKLKFVFQTSVNQPRQKVQAIIKDACAKAGIELELKSVTAAVFFGGDFANPDTYQKFWADMQMYTTTMTQPDPQLFMEQYCSWELARRTTSGPAATSAAGAVRSTTTCTRPRRSSSTRSSAPPCSSR